MPISQKLLLTVPTPLLGLLIVGSSVLLAFVIIVFIRYIYPHHKPKKENKVVIILFAAKTLIYALLLTVILFISWIGFSNTASDVQKEADSLVELYRSTESFLPELKDQVRVLLQEYVNSIINDEWKILARSELSPQTTIIARQIWSIYSHYSPKTLTEQIFLQESIRKLYEMRESRTKRLLVSETGIYTLLWIVLIIGEIVTLVSIAFFVEGFKDKLIMAVSFAILVGLIFFTILLFDYPFTGDFVVSAKPLTRIMAYW